MVILRSLRVAVAALSVQIMGLGPCPQSHDSPSPSPSILLTLCLHLYIPSVWTLLAFVFETLLGLPSSLYSSVPDRTGNEVANSIRKVK